MGLPGLAPPEDTFSADSSLGGGHLHCRFESCLSFPNLLREIAVRGSLSQEANQMAADEQPGMCLCIPCNGGVIRFSPAWVPSSGTVAMGPPPVSCRPAVW